MLKTKSYGVILVVALSAILGTGIVLAQTTMTIEIGITPATLNINLADIDDKCVTVHTNISYAGVNCTTLELMNSTGYSVASTACFPDNCGNLVVKFNRADVAGLVDSEDILELTLTLTGITLDGGSITGSDTIRVKQ